MDDKTREFLASCSRIASASSATQRAAINELVRIVQDQSAENDAIRADAEAWRKGMAMLEELRARVIPCGHTVGDLIGGEGSVTKCGACLATRRETKAPLLARLKAAIRRQTVDVDNGNKPNGPFEQAIEEIQRAVDGKRFFSSPSAARNTICTAMAEMCKAFAADNKELCEAASAYFGEDFNKP